MTGLLYSYVKGRADMLTNDYSKVRELQRSLAKSRKKIERLEKREAELKAALTESNNKVKRQHKIIVKLNGETMRYLHEEKHND